MSAVLSLGALSVRLPPGADRPHALKDVTLSLNANEIVCVVGESGSGKSMMANAVMRLLPQGVAIDGDVAQRLGGDGGEEDGLPGEQVHLAEEPGGAVADDLAAAAVEYRGLALEDGDQRVGRVADLEQLLADRGGALLAVLGQRPQLPGREDPAGRA
jgi:energy-coupling factor transporter ATP-binding protein EcfA2